MKKRIPKTFSDSLVKHLNDACMSTDCAVECEGLGWCNKVWKEVFGERKEVEEMKRKGCGK